MRPLYTAYAWPEDGVWTAEIAECNPAADRSILLWATDAHDRDAVVVAVRDLIALSLDQPRDSFDVDVHDGCPLYLRLGGKPERCLGYVRVGPPGAGVKVDAFLGDMITVLHDLSTETGLSAGHIAIVNDADPHSP